MKNLSAILNIIALLLIGVLFYLFFNRTEQVKKMPVTEQKQSSVDFRIAYFEFDSLKTRYMYFKDAESHAKEKESAMNLELSSLQGRYQKKITEWQQKGTSMTPAESQQAQQEYAEMQQTYQSRKEVLQEELVKNNGQVMTDIIKKIEAFLKEYNKQKNYSFIFAYEPNSFIYYKDSVYNITNDIIEGLNAGYKKKN